MRSWRWLPHLPIPRRTRRPTSSLPHPRRTVRDWLGRVRRIPLHAGRSGTLSANSAPDAAGHRSDWPMRAATTGRTSGNSSAGNDGPRSRRSGTSCTPLARTGPHLERQCTLNPRCGVPPSRGTARGAERRVQSARRRRLTMSRRRKPRLSPALPDASLRCTTPRQRLAHTASARVRSCRCPCCCRRAYRDALANPTEDPRVFTRRGLRDPAQRGRGAPPTLRPQWRPPLPRPHLPQQAAP